MTIWALILTVCWKLQIREPMDFFDLSDFAQTMHLAHAKNEISGAYIHGPSKVELTDDWRRRAVEAAQARGALPKGA